MLNPEIKRALRSLLRTPRASAIAVLTLALGIGACVAIFSVVHVVLLSPLPFPEPDRIVQMWQVNDETTHNKFSDPNFTDIYERSRSFDALAQYNASTVSVAGGSEPVRVRAASVSREFFDVLGVAPLRGRVFVDEELREGGRLAVLVSYGYWQRYLGSESDFSKLELRISRQSYAVVGVMPPEFDFPADHDAALWTARELLPRYPSRTAHNRRVV